MSSNPSEKKRRAASVAFVLALAVTVVLGGAGSALAQYDKPPAGGGGGAMFPMPGPCEQLAFENYLSNVARCKSIYCETWFWAFNFCDEHGLEQCEHNAQLVFVAALEDCGAW